MRAPSFWQEKKFPLWAQGLRPCSWLYYQLSALLQKTQTPAKASVPVICVGNLTLGGAGKTPITAFIAQHFKGAHILSRGYGRRSRALFHVDPQHHTADLVGDEPLLLSQKAPVWVGQDRQDLAQLATNQGAQLLLLDDGLQNRSLEKTLSLVVVDGSLGFGNEKVFPAGPLREPLSKGLEKADAMMIMGEDTCSLKDRFGGTLPLFRGKFELNPDDLKRISGRNLIAFSGIGYPEKFFRALENKGAVLKEKISFPDHYQYQNAELEDLLTIAKRQSGHLITTEKDWWRLSPSWRARILPLRGQATFDQPQEFINFIKKTCCIK